LRKRRKKNDQFLGKSWISGLKRSIGHKSGERKRKLSAAVIGEGKKGVPSNRNTYRGDTKTTVSRNWAKKRGRAACAGVASRAHYEKKKKKVVLFLNFKTTKRVNCNYRMNSNSSGKSIRWILSVLVTQKETKGKGKKGREGEKTKKKKYPKERRKTKHLIRKKRT